METIYSVSLLSGRQATSTATGSAVDIQAFDGEGYFCFDCGQATAGTNPTATFSLTECATSGGTYTAVTLQTTPTVVDGAAGAVHQAIAVNLSNLKRYVKAVCTIAGTSTPTFQFAVWLTGRKQIQA